VLGILLDATAEGPADVNAAGLLSAGEVLSGGSGHGEQGAVIILIHAHANADLAEVVDARGFMSAIPGTGQRGQEQAREDRDDGDNHEQFDEGESLPTQ
jgi:hypothetical protein